MSFTSASFYDSAISDTIFDSCDFSNADLSSCTIKNVTFRACRLTGALFSSSKLINTVFESAAAQYLSFEDSLLQNLLIADSDFTSSSFSRVKHSKLRIESSKLVSVSFVGTPLYGISLPSSDISGMILSPDMKELKGAVLDVSQCLDIARILGVEIS